MLGTLEGGKEAVCLEWKEGGLGTLVRRVNKAGVGVLVDQAGCCELW